MAEVRERDAADPAAIAKALNAAHEHLLFDAAAVQAPCETWDASPPDSERLLRWAKSLSDLRHDLFCHFALEEAGGFLDAVLARAPKRHEDAAALRLDHARLASGFTGLHEDAIATAIRRAGSAPELRERLRVLLRLLHAHEAREQALIQAVFYQQPCEGFPSA